MAARDDIDAQLDVSDEELEVLRRRYIEARRAGLSIAEARLFSESDQDVGLLRKCVANGWDGAQIARIVI